MKITKEEFIADLQKLINAAEEYEKIFLSNYDKYTNNDNLIEEIKEFRKDKEVYALIEKLEETHLRVRKNI